MKPLAASNIDSNHFVFTNFHLFHNVSSVSAFSVGESGLKSSQDSNRLMFFVFFHPKFKLQEFLARRLFVCSKQQTLRIVVAERLEGEKQMGSDRTASKSRTSGTAFA